MSPPVEALGRLAFAASACCLAPRLSILIFHRVHARPDPIFPDEPDAVRFEQLMRLVAASFRVMPLAAAAAALARGDLPRRAMVVSFDDGYADNAEVALPILRRLGLPATFFVATGFLDGGRMWNDSVIECVRAAAGDELDLGALGLGRHSLAGPLARRAAIDALLPQIKYLGLAERDEMIGRLQQACGVAALPDGLMMRSAQVVELHRAGMEIGGHTVRHPILARLEPVAAEREIADGRDRLQALTGAPVEVFAYPNGRPQRDYDGVHVAAARRLGFRAAVTTAPGVARAGDDLFQLPRFTPWDRSLAKWATRLLLNQWNTRFDRVAAA